MKKILYMLLILGIQHSIGNIATAQSWQWGKRGGGKTGSSTPDESLNGIAIDKHGNSYVLATVNTDKVSGDIDVDGNKLGKGNGDFDVCLVSFDCSGNYRWSKIIGGPRGETGLGLKLDTLGGVYLSVAFRATFGDTVKIGTDTIIGNAITATQYRQLFIIKYDTLGNYKWLRMPEPDTLSSYSRYSTTLSLDVSPSGSVSILTFINGTGAYAGGSYLVSTAGILHILKYDANGNFIKGFPMDITGGSSNIRMAWDYKNDVYYTLTLNTGSGFDGPIFGTTKMTGTNCLAKFSNTGANIWVRQSSTTWYTGTLSSTPVIDKDGNIYIGTSEGPSGNFNGYIATNSLAGANTVPMVVKLNPAGTNLWGFNGSSSITAFGEAIAVSDQGEVALSGDWVGQLKFGTISANSVASDLFFIRLDANTGALKSFDSLKSGSGTRATALAKDNRGNFYLGGTISATITIPTVGTLSKFGGKTDFFVAKYGVADCDAPVSISKSLVANASIKIYPNPAQEIVTIEGMAIGSELSLDNLVGQKLQSKKANNIKEEINLSQYSSGMYLLQIKSTDGSLYSTKIVKE